MRCLRITTVGLTVASALALKACDSRAEITMGQSARALSVGDVNHDGIPDLIVSSLSEPEDPVQPLEPEQLLVRLGRGDGTFGELIRSPGPYLSEHTVLSDLNRDSHPDVISSNFYGEVQVFRGAGNGSFAFAQQLPSCERAPSAAAGKFDDDDEIDIAVLCREEGTVYLRMYFGSAEGQFTAGGAYNLTPNRFLPADLDVGDMNGDALDDLVIVGSYNGQGSAIVHLNDGTGHFTALTPLAAGASAIKLADMDGDRDLDAVTAGSSLILLSASGDGTFTGARTLLATGPLSDVTVGDIDGDARLDVVATGSSTLHVLLAQDGGSYALKTLSTGGNSRDVALADFDRDGLADAANLNRTSPGSVSVYFNASLR